MIMDDARIKVSSITYAMKGRDFLRKRGFSASIERTLTPAENEGCGYSIYIRGNASEAIALLRTSGFRLPAESRGGDLF